MDNKQQLNDVRAMMELINDNIRERNTEVDAIDVKVNKIGNVVVTMSKRDNEFKDLLEKNANKVEQLTSVETDLKNISQTMFDEVTAVSGAMSSNKDAIESMTAHMSDLTELNKTLAEETKDLVTSHANTQMEHVSTLKTDIASMTEQLQSLDKTEELAMIETKLKHLQDKTQEAVEKTKQTEQSFLTALEELTRQINRVDAKMSECAVLYEEARANSSQTDARLKAIEYTLDAINELAQEQTAKQEPEQESTEESIDEPESEDLQNVDIEVEGE